jgi:AcrR family transcriptional regulator
MLMPMTPQPGLRERKKQRTREEIARAAHELFAERGYHATTLPEIAEAADVATRTIAAYFPSKEDILFSKLTQMKAALARALADRPAGKDTLETVREFILNSQVAERSRLGEQLHNDSTLRSHLRGRIAQLEEVIAPAIASDLGTDGDDPRTQLVAASLTSAFTLLAERTTSNAQAWTTDEVAAQIDPVFTFLRGGLEALKQPHSTRQQRAALAP